jgi:hypothetical protein
MSTFTYDASFNSASFFELFDSNFSADESGEANGQKVHYPGGNNNSIKDGGNEISEVAVNFALDTSDWTTLKGKLGTTGTLVCRGSDISASYYMKSYRAQKLKTRDIYKGSAVFWKD